ncbi:MAG: toll/interleukin-1 receptor domain-containing protein [Anaerolineae bacterium]|nr:toll/interleukin-1 receptor domain-containing protein [Anaerolineae bacterium]
MLYLCYTREDALLVTQLAEDLADLGVEVWFDLNEIAPGADWAVAQEAAIKASEGMVFVLSPEAMTREHMRHEINLAFENGKPVYLAAARRAPYREWMKGMPLADFRESYEAGLDALVLLIMEGKRAAGHQAPLDPAEAFLRQAEQQAAQQTTQRTTQQKSAAPETEEQPANWLRRQIRRLRQDD